MIDVSADLDVALTNANVTKRWIKDTKLNNHQIFFCLMPIFSYMQLTELCRASPMFR